MRNIEKQIFRPLIRGGKLKLSKYSDLVTLQCVSLIVRQFQNKTSDLLRKNLVSMSDNFATVSLTNHAKRLFVDTK